MNDTTTPRLSRDTVLRAALERLNEAGIDALSTRKLAEGLGVPHEAGFLILSGRLPLAVPCKRSPQSAQGAGHQQPPHAIEYGNGLCAGRSGTRGCCGDRCDGDAAVFSRGLGDHLFHTIGQGGIAR